MIRTTLAALGIVVFTAAAQAGDFSKYEAAENDTGANVVSSQNKAPVVNTFSSDDGIDFDEIFTPQQ